jgi:hypothetical protein
MMSNSSETDWQKAFLPLSQALTGCQTNVALSPGLDPEQYASKLASYVWEHADSSAIANLLNQFQGLEGKGDQVIADELLEVGSSSPSPSALAARQIAAAWYLGVWYPIAASGSSLDAFAGTVISQLAYVRSLAWRVAQAHPMGYSELTFGYWHRDPPSLTTYTGVSPSEDPIQET